MDDSLIVVEPIYQERVWGGRTLESKYGRRLPHPDRPYGESWEIVDREEAQSVVASGPFAGVTLHALWNEHRAGVFGESALTWETNRFPILVKILDARERLSIQVHPPADVAPALHGEPKTEMWYVVDADEGSALYAGLRRGVTAEAFRGGLQDGRTASQVHRLPAAAGDFLFLPSGRLHAIGAGFLIFEIQQNSDTTFRVYDWDRVGLDGRPRDLHVEESLRCIDFADIEPELSRLYADGTLVKSEYFAVAERRLEASGESRILGAGEFAIVAVVSGTIEIAGRRFRGGDFFMIPANASRPSRNLKAAAASPATILVTTLPAREPDENP